MLLKRITNLEHNALNKAQYVRRETIGINPIPQSILNTDLENNRLSHLRRAIARTRLHTRLKIMRRAFFRSPKSN